MPKETFFNLPEEKRERLIALAIEEFAEHDYRVASISRIVARAGIAKGSLYQYFEDKRDLFLYLLDLSNTRRLETLQAAQPRPEEAGFFEQLRWMLGGAVRVAVAHPQLSRLALRAYTSDLPFADVALERGKAMARGFLRGMVEAGIARGELAPDLDPELATAVVIAVMNEFNQLFLARIGVAPAALGDADVERFDSPLAHQLYDGLLRILERGLGQKTTEGGG